MPFIIYAIYGDDSAVVTAVLGAYQGTNYYLRVEAKIKNGQRGR